MTAYLLMGAREGMGASTLAVNIALSMVTLTERPMLLVTLGRRQHEDCAVLLGIASLRTMEALQQVMSDLPDAACMGWLTDPRRRVGTLALEDQVMAPSVVDRLQRLFPYWIVDAGETFTAAHAAFDREQSWWGLVVTPEPRAFLAGNALLATWNEAFIARHRTVCLVNRWDPSSRITEALLRETLHRAPSHWIPETASATAAAAEGVPLVMRDPHGPFATVVSHLAATWMATVREATPESAVAVQMPVEGQLAESSSLANDRATLHEEILTALYREETIATVAAIVDPAQLREALAATLRTIIAALPSARLSGVDREALLHDVCNEAIGMGPLESLVTDATVTEIMVNGPSAIYCERHGRVASVAATFRNAAHLRHLIGRLLAPTGRRVDDRSPIVDVRLRDGSRLNVVLPPVALQGPLLTIRRHRSETWCISDLQRAGAMTSAMAASLIEAVQRRKNLLVIGGTGSGKTTLLRALATAIAPDERIITIEDAAELRLAQPHVVPLEARPPNIEGAGEITIRTLVRTALRMRPDRIIVGECRGGEALDMLQAMHTGHEGSMTTLHANTPDDAMTRLATLVYFSGVTLPLHVVREQIAGAIHLVVTMRRDTTGHRRVTALHAVCGVQDERVVLSPLIVSSPEDLS
ncbi:MAG: Flp pilus assembly complex ATPase component TadA [Deltaproteobacteria bacterium]|nr:Flp pilus assembly complex ATPase component TadA [Deltaproteobacteria bacterium]